jgi:hypothetical protein
MDLKWWNVYGSDVAARFAGERVSVAKVPKVNRFGMIPHYSNSGAASMSLAASRGAKRIVMLGYDCQKTDGKAHWHGDHVAQLGNARSMPKWPENFAKLAAALKRAGVEVVNASRATALACFPLSTLEESLGPDAARTREVRSDMAA